MGYGTITAYALMSLEARGTLFVTPGMEVISLLRLIISLLAYLPLHAPNSHKLLAF